jgi:hypothetical protein
MYEAAIKALKKKLQENRQASLDATRQGDFLKVARLTTQSAQINRQIMEAEDRREAAVSGANPRDAKRG